MSLGPGFDLLLLLPTDLWILNVIRQNSNIGTQLCFFAAASQKMLEACASYTSLYVMGTEFNAMVVVFSGPK